MAPEAVKAVIDMAYEGANDLDDPFTPQWDCSVANQSIITRNVDRFVRIAEALEALLSEQKE